jgi:hypothetical protein
VPTNQPHSRVFSNRRALNVCQLNYRIVQSRLSFERPCSHLEVRKCRQKALQIALKNTEKNCVYAISRKIHLGDPLYEGDEKRSRSPDRLSGAFRYEAYDFSPRMTAFHTFVAFLAYVALVFYHSTCLPPTLPPTALATTKPAYLALCAAVKERPDDLKEWADYHVALGFSKLYLMLTDDPAHQALETALAEHLRTGTVELYPLPRVNPRTIAMLQVRLYDACLQAARNVHTWVAFWDGDEFLVPMDVHAPALPELLGRFEEYGGVAVSWRTVGPSGHVYRPSGGVLPSYLRCVPWNHSDCSEIKTIVNVEKAIRPTTDPHTFVYEQGAVAVDMEAREVEGHINPYVAEDWRLYGRAPRWALYHYATKSEEEFRNKSRRGSAMGNRKGREYFDGVNAAATERCEEALLTCARLGLKHCIGSAAALQQAAR